MKKFLCYDTNDAASGKIGVNSNGVLSPNATVPSTNGASYQQLVTDSDGNAKWEDRLAYSDTVETDITGKSYQSGTRSSSNTMTFAEPIPFEMGQKWKVFTTNTENGSIKEVMDVEQPSKEVLFEVQESDDGTLYIGAGLYPFCIYADHAEVNAAWASMSQVGTIKVVCISGVITEKVVKTIDPKYIKDMYCDNRTILVEQTRVKNAVDGPIIKPSLLINGTPVIVNIDGTEYNATLEEGGTYMIGTGASNCYYHIGNSGGINISSKTTFTSGYPFFVVISEDGTCMVLFDGESAGPTGTKHEFAIYSGSIKQIDPKYIPNTDVFFVTSSGSFRTGTDWDSGEDATIADIVTAYHDGGARIFQMSSGNCIGISNVIGASASDSSSPFITYYDYTSKTVFTKS